MQRPFYVTTPCPIKKLGMVHVVSDGLNAQTSDVEIKQPPN